MSKFFKWLKKDKQQEESPVVNQDLPQMTEGQVNSEVNSIKNNSSSDEQSTPKYNEETQPEHIQKTSDSAALLHIQKALETDSAELENNCSYTVKTTEGALETPPKPAEAVPKVIITEPVVENTRPLESTTLAENESTIEALDKASVEQQDVEKIGFFSKLKRGLSRTKESIGSGIIGLLRGKAIDDELFEELETQLLVADVGINTTVKIIKQLTESSDRKQLKDGDALYQLLKEQMAEILHKVESPLTLETESGPFVILMVGVNGVG